MITLHSSRYRHLDEDALRRMSRRRMVDGAVFVISLSLIVIVLLFVAGCATFGQKGHWTKQEQERFLRTGK